MSKANKKKAAAQNNYSDDEDKRPSPVAKKGGKKEKVAKAVVAHDDDDDSDRPVKSQSAFNALMDDDEEEEAPVMTAAQLKKMKKRQKQQAAEEEEEDEQVNNAAPAEEEEEEDAKPAKPAPKKGKAKKDNKALASKFALMEDDEEEQEQAAPSEPAPAPTPAPAEQTTAEQEEDNKGAAAGGKGKKKKDKKKKDDDFDLDALLAELDGPKAAPAAAAPAAAAPAAAAAAPAPADAAAPAAAPAAEAAMTAEEKQDAEDAKAAESGKLSKGQLKRLKEKQKEAERKAAAAAGVAAPTPAAAPAPAAEPAKPKKETAAMRALKEALERKKAEEERLRREEEERIAAEKAEIARLEAEAKAAEAARLARIEARAAKKRELERMGQNMSAKQKEKMNRARSQFEQMRGTGGVVVRKAKGLSDDEEDTAATTKKGPRIPKKKKGPKMTNAQIIAERIHKQEEAKRQREEQAQAAHNEAAAAVSAVEADIKRLQREIDDWGKGGAAAKSEEEVADAWDASSGDDEPEQAGSNQHLVDALAEAQQKLTAAQENLARVDAEAKARDEAAAAAADDNNEEQSESEDEESKDSPTGAAGFAGTVEEAPKRKINDKRELRSPICCILGHVDTGKTKLLDYIRNTNVQEGEAGGITQQIGATYFPMETINKVTSELNASLKRQLEMKVPGLLVIDTPGHESFTNLRSRGSNLCDIAILVVDIMHGLEQQTIESIDLLKKRKTPFVVALNKIDRCYNWKPIRDSYFQKTFDSQGQDTKDEFERRAQEAINLLSGQGLNTCLYYDNKDMRKVISVVPTSAVTGEGVPDLLMLLVQLTQNMMADRISYLSSLQATVLEVKQIEGLGTTVDVVLVNGVIHRGATIVVCGLNGPIVTTIRDLLTPHPNKEIRVKGDYLHHESVKAAMGVKIVASGLEGAVAGTELLVCEPGDDLETMKDEVMADLASILSKVDHSGVGVYVQASTLGALEALLTFLGEMKIPVSGISLGPVFKKDVIKASAVRDRKPEYAVILAFDVRVSADARDWALRENVRIFTAEIIYHLFDQWKIYLDDIKRQKREDAQDVAVFPVVLEILPQYIYRTRDPIVLGVKVVDGILKLGTPLCVPDKQNLNIGRITNIQVDHKDRNEAKKGEEVCVCIETAKGEQKLLYGRQFDHENLLYSLLTRKSIDLLKENFRDDLNEAQWRLVIKIKQLLGVDVPQAFTGILAKQ